MRKNFTIQTKYDLYNLGKKHGNDWYEAYNCKNIELVRSEAHLEEKLLPSMTHTDIYINQVSNIGTRNWEQLFLRGKNACSLGKSFQEPGNRVLYYLKDGLERGFVL